MAGTYHGNKIDKLGKMIWPQSRTEVLQIMTRRQDKCHCTKKLSLEQSSSLDNQIHDIDPTYLKKERVKNLKFPQKQHRDESIKTHSSAIHLKGWARHFKHEYIIKLPKKGSRFPLVESNAELRSQVSLIQANSDPKYTQIGFSTSFPIHCSILAEIIFIMVSNSQ